MTKQGMLKVVSPAKQGQVQSPLSCLREEREEILSIGSLKTRHLSGKGFSATSNLSSY